MADDHGRRSRNVTQSSARLGWWCWWWWRRVCKVLRAPGFTPVCSVPAVHDVDALVGDLVVTELEQVHREHPRCALVTDQVLDDDQVVPVRDATGVELQPRRILTPPLPNVGNSFEALSRLRKLQDRVLVIDLVGEVLVSTGILPVPFQRPQQCFVVEHAVPPCLMRLAIGVDV